MRSRWGVTAAVILGLSLAVLVVMLNRPNTLEVDSSVSGYENRFGMRFIPISVQSATVAGRAVLLQESEVTRAQFRHWKTPPGRAASDDYPVTHVSWQEAMAFCRWLSAEDPEADYRLPTRTEWRSACRTQGPQAVLDRISSGGANVPDLSLQQKYPEFDLVQISDGFSGLAPVKSYPPDPAGFYDIIGNAAELVSDIVPISPEEKKAGVPQRRYVCGGSFHPFADVSDGCATTAMAQEGKGSANLGIRLVALAQIPD